MDIPGSHKPYGSFWQGEGKSLMGDSTMAVEELYRELGGMTERYVGMEAARSPA